MSRASQGSNRKRSWSRLIALCLGLSLLTFGSMASASDPIDAPDTEVRLTQDQPNDSPVVDDMVTDQDTIDLTRERDNSDSAQAQTDPSNPFGRTTTIAFNRRR